MSNYIPDLRYLPDRLTTIDRNTQLAPSIRLSTFLKNNTLDHITDINEKKQIVRNLLPHAHIMRMVRENTSQFADYTLEVVEGVYKAGPEEDITSGSINDLKSKGQAIVYKVVRNGVPNADKTYDFTIWMNIFVKHFGKVYLDYDQYDPSGDLAVQVIIEMPSIPESYNVRFNREVVTTFNNTVQSTNELIQVTEDNVTTQDLAFDTTSTVTTTYWTVGDSQARRAAAAAGAPWNTFAGEGLTSRDQIHVTQLGRIPPNSSVVISLGENDVNNTRDTVEDIAKRIIKIVQVSIDAGHYVSFLLIPVGSQLTLNTQRRIDFITAMQAELDTVSNNVQTIALNESEFTLARDGRHVTDASYITALRRLV